jgi:hypothetical protein
MITQKGYAGVSVIGSHLGSNLIFMSLLLLTNIRLALKCFLVVVTVAHYVNDLITIVKKFMIQDPRRVMQVCLSPGVTLALT